MGPHISTRRASDPNGTQTIYYAGTSTFRAVLTGLSSIAENEGMDPRPRPKMIANNMVHSLLATSCIELRADV